MSATCNTIKYVGFLIQYWAESFYFSDISLSLIHVYHCIVT